MKKDAYYFPHFCNARHDRKIKRIVKDLGVEGYGIFFMLLEVLREQTDFKYPVQDIDLLADEFGTTEAKVQVIIKNYGLFEMDQEEMFFSPKLIFYLQPYLEKSERARLAAHKRWETTNQIENKSNANASQMQSDSNASKVKNSKVNESKIIKEYTSNVDLQNAINDFIDNRAKMKTKMTDKAIKLLLTKLTEFAKDNDTYKIEMLNTAIMNGWKSVYPKKDDKQNITNNNKFLNFDDPDYDFEAIIRDEKEYIEADVKRIQAKAGVV